MLTAAAIILTLFLWAGILWFATAVDALPPPPVSLCYAVLVLLAIAYVGSCAAIFAAYGLGWIIVVSVLDILVVCLIAAGGGLPWPFWVFFLAVLMLGVKLV
jgi:hypothetical protein